MRLTPLDLAGTAAGPHVVQLAGIVGGCLLYRETGEALAGAGYRVALLDTAGDRRDDPARVRLTWDFLAGEVVAGLDALGAGSAILYGTSFGCLVALATAARFPSRVAALLLAHPPDPARRLFAPVVRWAERRKDPVGVTRHLFNLAFTGMVCWEFASPSALRRLPSLAAEAARAATPTRTLHEKLSLLWTEPPGLPAREGLPVSIIASPLDPVAPLRGARAWAGRLPGARLRVLPFTGHSGHFSRPRAFTRLVLEEMQRLSESG